MSLPFNSCRFVLMSCKVSGWSLLENLIPKGEFTNVIYNAQDDLEGQYSDWDSDQGFGSSDSTYAMKYFLDSIILNNGFGDKLKTDFTPCLSIVEKV